MFNNLVKLALQENAENVKKRIEYLALHDSTLRNWSTETRWNQYEAGTITKEQAVAYAAKRIAKDAEKRNTKTIAKIEKVAAAPDLQFITINTWFTKSGSCHAEISTNTGRYSGVAHGYGYDKQSAAVAECFNADPAILKVLYTLKENGIKAGKKKSAFGDNRDIIGYGAGYSEVPYFEGGVGIECFISILKKAGYETRTTYGKNEMFYSVYKTSEN